MTTEPREQQEPSMEEILSSIRRIIADEERDDNSSGGDDHSGHDELGVAESQSEALDDAEALARGGRDEDADEDVLELTKVVRESGEVIDLQGERSSSNNAMDHDEIRYRDNARESDDQRLQVAPLDQTPEPQPAGARWDHIQRKEQVVPSPHTRTAELMSTATASVAGGAFARLSQALQRTPEEESVADGAGRTVEQFIEDIARPMLKDWLDQNLPAIVEQLVQKEIQKISRRAELI